MAGKSEVNDFDFLDRMIGPKNHATLSDDDHLHEPSDAVSLDIIAFQKWVGAKFLQKAENLVPLFEFHLRERFSDVGFHKN